MSINYFSQELYPLPIREDLPEAYRAVWKVIAEPGNWWNAEQRLAIAQEVRNAQDCERCKARNLALSPNGVEHKHPATNLLSGGAVDAVHRIANDASRLSQSFVESLRSDGVSDGHYIELLGIVVAVISIDAFHTALGADLEVLPEPQPGAPSEYRPPGAKARGAWIDSVAPEDLSAPEADLYGGSPQAGNVLSAMSLVPGSVSLLNTLSSAQYLNAVDVPNPKADGGRAINRMQIELLAGRVSSINECFY